MDDSFNSDPSAYNNAVSNHNVDNNLSPNQGTLSQSSSSDWMWRAGSISSNSAPPPVNYQLYPFTPYPDLNAAHPQFPPPQQDTIPAPKIAIPRATSAKTASQRRRSARACEACRQRKVKCDGGRPECRKCREHGLNCSYIDIKRIRDQKQLGVLSEKVERYEKLLRQLEHESDPVTTKRIRKALSAHGLLQSDGDGDADAEGADDGSDADSSTSHGSLDEIDLVKEDLNRSDKTVATGFFGKNSEVAWMQKLEDVSGRRSGQLQPDGKTSAGRQIPITSMSYHLDDLILPFPDTVDPFAMPPKSIADKYFSAYMRSVHPAFMVVRQNTFTSQYEQFFTKKFVNPPRKWLAVLNMIFALGCRFCKLTGEINAGGPHTDDLEFLNRTRRLCLYGNVLFEHDDLQQIQVLLLVAFYLVALGQVNTASKFSSMALRSAISLGINLRFKDDKTHYASKEARCRLWWSIFLLEHLLTSITGRISGCGEGLSAALLPIPFDERIVNRRPSLSKIFHDTEMQAKRLQLTIYQNEDEARVAADWLVRCEPCPMLLFHYVADLSIIAQTVINSVYSIQGLRQSPGQLEERLQNNSKSMDIWLRKIPEFYRFSLSPTDDRFHIDSNVDYVRERITLAIYYYSARITLCRPCLSHTPCSLQKARDPDSKSSFRATMTLECLRASCSLLSILPEEPDTVWLTTVTPWWAVLHYIMQATTALLIGLSTCATSDKETNTADQNKVPSLTREMLVNETRKAFFWLHHMAFSSRAARRAFVICESFMGRMGPSLGFDLEELPSSETLPPQGEDIDMSENGLAMVDDG
ncbi:fungal-specific transcription factor domain-containing protein [Aspergillus pseudoustus]|uniref:Fungal-specific transcription factor domain-containing protein n=1 Tax=Aspergillus pseudoustus TaxID=1810923 RepID=A0ABR4JPK1_9EURO